MTRAAAAQNKRARRARQKGRKLTGLARRLARGLDMHRALDTDRLLAEHLQRMDADRRVKAVQILAKAAMRKVI